MAELHSECEATLLRTAREKGGTIEVFYSDPGSSRGYVAEGLTCPHGVRFWVRPTLAQMRAWETEPS